MSTETIIDKHEGDFIYYDGKYWLVDKYDSEIYDGGFFAHPLFFPKTDTVKVGVGAANWCYKSNGAYICNPSKETMKKAYQSFIEHLEWCKKIQSETNCDLTKINAHLQHYYKLLNQITLSIQTNAEHSECREENS